MSAMKKRIIRNHHPNPKTLKFLSCYINFTQHSLSVVIVLQTAVYSVPLMWFGVSLAVLSIDMTELQPVASELFVPNSIYILLSASLVLLPRSIFPFVFVHCSSSAAELYISSLKNTHCFQRHKRGIRLYYHTVINVELEYLLAIMLKAEQLWWPSIILRLSIPCSL